MNSDDINLLPNSRHPLNNHQPKARQEKFDMYVPDEDELDSQNETKEEEPEDIPPTEKIEKTVENKKTDPAKQLPLVKKSFWTKLKNVFTKG